MKDLFIVKTIVKQGLKAFAIQFPAFSFLATGWLSPLTSWVMEKGLMFLVKRTALKFSIIQVNFETDEEKEAFREAVIEARDAIKAGKYLTQEEKDELDNAVQDAFRDFIHLRRVREPNEDPRRSRP